MKIWYGSDLHLEFGQPFAMPDGADVYVLAGDIAQGIDGVEWACDESKRLGRPVIYVLGNHEHYGRPERTGVLVTDGERGVSRLITRMKETAGGSAVHVLENDAVILDGVRFLGCTLWTDFAIAGEEAIQPSMVRAKRAMADYRCIRFDATRLLRPEDTRDIHMESRAWLASMLAAAHDGPTVVVTHHGPSMASCADGYRGDPLNGAFLSNLEEMMDAEQAQVWIHGHTHHCVDYLLNGTRVVSNQRGYPREATGFDFARVVEVSNADWPRAAEKSR
jgi:predicted phosphodiesterase